jgi:TrmH family RNA methyltransferase
MKRITSRANPHFKALKALSESSREQRKQGLTLLEGSHLVVAYHARLGVPERLIVSELGMAQEEIASLQGALGECETLLLADSLLSEISALATPPGILAVIRIPPAPGKIDDTGSIVLLDAVQDAGNVGSILRTAAAAGIGDVFLGAGCAGVWTPRVLRSGQGAHFDLRLHEQADLHRVMAEFAGTTLAATAHDGEDLYQLDLVERIAWLFGNEGAGVSAALAANARGSVLIPMTSGCESLNVAAAAAICLFEEVRQKRCQPDH